MILFYVKKVIIQYNFKSLYYLNNKFSNYTNRERKIKFFLLNKTLYRNKFYLIFDFY